MKPAPGLAQQFVGQPDLAEQLMRALALKGELPRETERRFGLSITVDDFSTRPEYDFLRRMNRVTAKIQTAAVAAQFPIAAIGLPPTSSDRQVIAVVDRIVLNNNNAAAVSVQIGLSSSTLVVPNSQGNTSDDRAASPTASGFIVSRFQFGTTNNAANPLFATLPNFWVPPNQSLVLPNEFVYVLTGKVLVNTGNLIQLYFVGEQVNTVLQLATSWRERSLLSSEQQ